MYYAFTVYSAECALYSILQSPKFNPGYRHETQYQKPGYINIGLGNFVDTNIFVKKYFLWSLYVLLMFSRFLNQNLPKYLDPKYLDPKKETREFRWSMLP